MAYNPKVHHRRSIRLKGYDYTQPGAYFITLVTADHESVFGEIVDGTMRLNAAGRMVEREWKRLASRFPSVRPGAFVIMPNHLHGIIEIVSAPDSRTGTATNAEDGGPNEPGRTGTATNANDHGSNEPRRAPTRPGTASNANDRGLDEPHRTGTATNAEDGGPNEPRRAPTTEQFGKPVPGSIPTIVRSFKSATTLRMNSMRRTPGAVVWHTNYYEHVVRDPIDLHRICEYIETNPRRWQEDQLSTDTIHPNEQTR